MLKLNDKITIVWNQEGLNLNESNGHYPNEIETIVITRIDDEFYYDDNVYVEIEKTDKFYKLNDNHYTNEKALIGG